MNNQANKVAFKMLIVDEGIQLKPYICTGGKLTIGVGRNLNDKGISRRTAAQMLEEDIEEAAFYTRQLFGEDWIEKAGAIRTAAIINMIFNIGPHGFSNFKKTIEHLRNFEFEKAAVEALDSKWAKQVGARAYRVALAIARAEIDDDYNKDITL